MTSRGERLVLGSAPSGAASIAAAGRAAAPGEVWLLQPTRRRGEDPGLAIAERLGVPFRQVPLDWKWIGALGSFSRAGSLLGLRTLLPAQTLLPCLTLSSGPQAARVAAWLKRRAGSTMVHCGTAGFPGSMVDLLVLDQPGMSAGRLMPVLGAPHRLSAFALATARHAWREQLAHLPHPRLALFMGGAGSGFELPPHLAHAAAVSIAKAVADAKGAVLAVAEPSLGREATEALAAGLRDTLHLLYRTGEPGPDAALGFLASSDAVVVAGQAPSRLLQACASPVPVYALPLASFRLGLGCPLQRRLLQAGHIRLLEGRIDTWRRPSLDEAGRVAQRIHELVNLHE